MRALVHDPKAPAGLRHAETADPTPAPDQVLVEVRALSLNSGEIRHLPQMRSPGEVPERGTGLLELGAAQVVVGLDGIDAPVAGVLDNVGGELLTAAYDLVEPEGTVVAIGSSAGDTVTLDLEAARVRGGGMSIVPIFRGNDGAADLAYLVGLLQAGALDPQIGWRGSWDDVHSATEALLSRSVAGKAVLDVGHPGR